MSAPVSPSVPGSGHFARLGDDVVTRKKVAINLRRNRKQDKTELIDEAAAAFDYDAVKDAYWNPERFSLLWGTPIWDAADERQRVALNQLYWVAYYAQIISAEIATIFFNQTSAAGLYAVEDFKDVCDMLDLESAQERTHIAAFKTIGEATERALFGHRLFTYPMRGPYAETMIFQDTGPFRRMWKSLQLRTFGLLSSGNAFIACQYFLVRGLRTLNGKLVQHQLSRYYDRFDREDARGAAIEGARDKDSAPAPSRISYFHFCDESYHFNSSTIVSHDVVRSLKPPTAFEKRVVNLGVLGCQKDHARFSATCSGVFWFDPAAFDAVYRLLTSRVFGLDDKDARELMRRTYTEENDGLYAGRDTHRLATESYERYLADLPFLSAGNRGLQRMKRTTLDGVLAQNRRALRRWRPSRAAPTAFDEAAT